jgi:predicted HAD superfamily phosphohydrolase YqeG
MPGDYARLTRLADVRERASETGLRTLVVDVEPLVAWWDSGQEALDEGVTALAGQLSGLPGLQVLVFATNSARRPSSLPALPGVRVSYLASAGKPLRTAPYRGLPKPAAVVGDQLLTDGLLARRLGFAFLHWDPALGDPARGDPELGDPAPAGIPAGPRLLHRLGLLTRPLVFGRNPTAR